MTKMTEQPNELPRRRRRSKLGVNLGTLLAAMTLAATYLAYTQEREKLLLSEDRVARANFRTGQLPQGNLDAFQIIAEEAGSEWLIWVPFGKELQLRIQTHGLSSTTNVPKKTRNILLSEGNHHVFLERATPDSWQVIVNGEQRFLRSESRTWNITRLKYHPLPFTIIKSNQAPILMQEAYGKAHLEAGENYDPNLHSFGIRMWADASD